MRRRQGHEDKLFHGNFVPPFGGLSNISARIYRRKRSTASPGGLRGEDSYGERRLTRGCSQVQGLGLEPGEANNDRVGGGRQAGELPHAGAASRRRLESPVGQA